MTDDQLDKELQNKLFNYQPESYAKVWDEMTEYMKNRKAEESSFLKVHYIKMLGVATGVLAIVGILWFMMSQTVGFHKNVKHLSLATKEHKTNTLDNNVKYKAVSEKSSSVGSNAKFVESNSIVNESQISNNNIKIEQAAKKLDTHITVYKNLNGESNKNSLSNNATAFSMEYKGQKHSKTELAINPAETNHGIWITSSVKNNTHPLDSSNNANAHGPITLVEYASPSLMYLLQPKTILINNTATENIAFVESGYPFKRLKYEIGLSLNYDAFTPNKVYKSAHSYEVNFYIMKPFGKFLMSTGIGFQSMDWKNAILKDSSVSMHGLSIHKTDSVWVTKVDTTIGVAKFVFNNKIKTISADSMYKLKKQFVQDYVRAQHFVSIPLNIGHRFLLSSRFSLDVMAGTAFLLNSSQAYTYYLGEGKYQTIKPINALEAHGVLGINYSLTERIGINGNVHYSYSTLLKTSTLGNITWNSKGLGLGLTYKF